MNEKAAATSAASEVTSNREPWLMRLAGVKNDIHKSGIAKNAVGFQGKYIALEAYLPEVTRLMYEHGLCDVVSTRRIGETIEEKEVVTEDSRTITKKDVSKYEMVLTIYDVFDTSNHVEFSVPFVYATLSKGNNAQCLGASVSYLKRYLYNLAFNICECDAVEEDARRTAIIEETKKIMEEFPPAPPVEPETPKRKAKAPEKKPAEKVEEIFPEPAETAAMTLEEAYSMEFPLGKGTMKPLSEIIAKYGYDKAVPGYMKNYPEGSKEYAALMVVKADTEAKRLAEAAENPWG